jgi:adenosylhomocysteine nucleosidase
VNQIVFDDPCVIFSLALEAKGFDRLFRTKHRIAGAPYRARSCVAPALSVVVLEAGVGAERVAAALGWALGRPRLDGRVYEPRLVINAGYAGALHEGLAVGDVVLASEVATPDSRHWPVPWPGPLLSERLEPTLHRGPLLTVIRIIGTPSEKRELGATHGALAADMESAMVASICARRGVPFGCVRAISDDINAPLSPQLARMLSGGRVSPVGLATALIRKPTLIAEFWRLARHTRRASDQLGKALAELLTSRLANGT